MPASSKHLWVIFFGFALLLGNVVSIMSGLPAAELFPFFTTNVSVIIFYFVIAIIVPGRRELRWLLAALVLGSVAVSITSLSGYGWMAETEQGTRAGGLGGNVNELAFNLLVALPIAFGFVIGVRSFWMRVGAVIALAILLSTVAVSLSRSAYLAALVMWLFGIIRFRRVDLLKYAIPGAIVFGVGIAFLPDPVAERIATLDSKEARGEDASVRTRVVTNRNGLEAFVRNPLVGVGMRNFMNWERREIRSEKGGHVIHNAYLSTAAELGLIGFVPLILIIGLTWNEFGLAWRSARLSYNQSDPQLREYRVMGLLLQVSFLGTLVGGLFHPSLEYKAFWLLFGLSPPFLALVRSRIREIDESQTVGRLAGASSAERDGESQR
jgi:O-antigen ligase